MEKEQQAEREASAAEQQAPETEAVEQPEAAGAGEAPVEESAAQPSADEMQLLLEDERAKADEHYNQLMRARAELDNLRKRQARELENAHKYALERFVAELLPVRDSMELGLSAASADGADLATLREGNELTLKLLADVMEKFEVVQIDPQGEPFNHDFHQAMSIQPRSDVPPNTVVAVVQKGYTLNGRLVRPAMVMVSQAAE